MGLLGAFSIRLRGDASAAMSNEVLLIIAGVVSLCAVLVKLLKKGLRRAGHKRRDSSSRRYEPLSREEFDNMVRGAFEDDDDDEDDPDAEIGDDGSIDDNDYSSGSVVQLTKIKQKLDFDGDFDDNF